MLAEQHDSACQDSERTFTRAPDEEPASQCKVLSSQCKDPSHGSRKDDEYRTGGAASHKRQREEPSETNSNKANREKMRRDRLNDRFEELARALERSELARADRGSILVDAVRVLAQLRAETSRLRGSAQHMSEQIQELKAEKSELREERARLLANKQQLEDEVRRLAASGAAQSTAATSAAASVVSAARPTAATPPLGFAPYSPCAPPGSPGSPGAVPLMLHPAFEPGKLAPLASAAAGAGGAAVVAAAGGGGATAAGARPTAPAAAAGPQYMPYAMPGMPPMGMWQWLPQPAVDPSFDQKLRGSAEHMREQIRELKVQLGGNEGGKGGTR
ncbi:unnamed protein product [Closterium sp. Naga37s-1]|nr:unnamed protein product [Closterium sp. Naga37s-1]